MSEISEKVSEMSSVEFSQYALRNHVAPPAIGSVKARLRHAGRRLGWSANRIKDAWYADPRITMSADEIHELEALTGLRYGREELRTVDDLIARADALLDGPEADFFRPFVDAVRAMARLAHRTGTEG